LPAGRPSSYSLEIALQICEQIATRIAGLDKICSENPAFPESRTVHRWLEEHEDFRQLYRGAKELQADLCAYGAFDQLDDPYAVRNVGDPKLASPEIQRRKALAEHERWMAGRLHPHKWGDRTGIELSGGETPVKIEGDLSSLLSARLQSFLRAKEREKGGSE
jgi:hypothetical protein